MDVLLRGKAGPQGGREEVKGKTVLVLGGGPHEIGPRDNWNVSLSSPSLPALPLLVHRVIGDPGEAGYVCRRFGPEARVHGQGMRQAIRDYASRRDAMNVLGAVLKAGMDGQAGVVVLIDRDRRRDDDTIRPLQAGRDAAAQFSDIPCAVGQAVEAFDAWMIADGKAVAEAGGNASRSHPAPENLNGEEGTGNHPKERAAEIFGGSEGLGAKCAQIASTVNIEFLKKSCPVGFAPFAAEVKERIAPVLKPA